jgi:GTPase SAR1 family protein
MGKGVSMAKYDSTSLRNVAIIGHGGTGKTSLCEAFLFTAGKTDRPGRVDDGSSGMDYNPKNKSGAFPSVRQSISSIGISTKSISLIRRVIQISHLIQKVVSVLSIV